jgi:hypothetical protein
MVNGHDVIIFDLIPVTLSTAELLTSIVGVSFYRLLDTVSVEEELFLIPTIDLPQLHGDLDLLVRRQRECLGHDIACTEDVVATEETGTSTGSDGELVVSRRLVGVVLDDDPSVGVSKRVAEERS